jgi:hypothetical protein
MRSEVLMLLRRLLPGLAALILVTSLPFTTQGRDDKPGEKKDDKAKPKVNFVWKFDFEKKTPIYQKLTTKTDQKFTVQGNIVSQSQEQTFWFSWTPEKKENNDTFVIKQKVEGVKMSIDIGNQKIQYDSTGKASTDNNPLNEFFKALIGSEFTITLDKNYKVLKIEGYEKFVKELTKANPTMKPLLETILNEDALKGMIEPTFALLPGKEESEGEKWSLPKRNLDMGPIGTYTNEYTMTYVGKDANNKALDKIDYTTTLKYEAPKEDKQGGSLPFKIKSADLNSKDAKGVLLYNSDKGWIESSEMTMTLDGNLNIEIGGQTTQVTINQTQTSKVETTDKKPTELEPKK